MTINRNMTKQYTVLILLVLSLMGCASRIEHEDKASQTQDVLQAEPAPQEQQGGISGTGQHIDCQQEQYKNEPACHQP